MAYSKLVIEHYENPKNVGKMDPDDPCVGTGLVGAPSCGDVLRLQIKIDPVTDTIIDAKWKTYGCGSAIAASSYVSEVVRGLTLKEAGEIKNSSISEELALPP